MCWYLGIYFSEVFYRRDLFVWTFLLEIGNSKVVMLVDVKRYYKIVFFIEIVQRDVFRGLGVGDELRGVFERIIDICEFRVKYVFKRYKGRGKQGEMWVVLVVLVSKG